MRTFFENREISWTQGVFVLHVPTFSLLWLLHRQETRDTGSPKRPRNRRVDLLWNLKSGKYNVCSRSYPYRTQVPVCCSSTVPILSSGPEDRNLFVEWERINVTLQDVWTIRNFPSRLHRFDEETNFVNIPKTLFLIWTLVLSVLGSTRQETICWVGTTKTNKRKGKVKLERRKWSLREEVILNIKIDFI